jgi:azurin
MRIQVLFLLVVGLLVLAACGGGGDETEVVAKPTAAQPTAPAYQQVDQHATTPTATSVAPAATVAMPHGDIELVISTVGESFEFDKNHLAAGTGDKVVVSFKNESASLQHNWVLVENGTKDSVAMDGLLAGAANHYVPADSNVLASTTLLDAGQTGNISFDALAAGTYQFVCTFPGHNLTMYGEFKVVP